MSFYISKKDGKFCIDHSINDKALYYIKFNSGTAYEVIPVNFQYRLPLGMTPWIHIENLNSKNEYGCTVYDYEISVYTQNAQESASIRIAFSSKRPLGVETSNTNRTEKAVLRFWEILDLFDSTDEVLDVVSTRNVLEYTDAVELSERIERLSYLADKYQGKLPYGLRNDIIDWIRNGLIRFGISTQKLSQTNIEQFSKSVHLLNNLGYQVYKS